jgi:signal transduction histidine kinase
LEKLQATSDSLARVVGGEETLRLIVESLVSLGYCFAAFLALDEEKGVLTDYVLSTGPEPLMKEAQQIIPPYAELPLTSEEHLAVRCLRTLEVQITHDLAEITVPIIDPVAARLVQRAAGLKAIAVIPVLVGGQPFGVWITGSDEKDTLDSADLRTLVTFANQAGLAIERAQLYDRLYEKTTMLEEALQELRETQDRLIRSERLSSMGRLAANIAHEINNPLQAVRTCLELTLEEMKLDQPVDGENVEIAHREIKRVIQILRRLMNLQRPSGEEKTPLDINNVVQEVLALMAKQLLRAGVTVGTELDPDLPPVLGHGNQLEQVFLNLALNALEAMPDGGTLRVETGRTGEGLVTIAFCDTGVGIPPSVLPRIFEPSFTTKAHGLGLGLTVCQTILEAHRGTLDVSSEANRGACFRVELPALESRTDA